MAPIVIAIGRPWMTLRITNGSQLRPWVNMEPIAPMVPVVIFWWQGRSINTFVTTCTIIVIGAEGKSVAIITIV